MKINDLVKEIEQDQTLSTTGDRVRALVGRIPPDRLSSALTALAADHFRLREMARHWGDDAAKGKSKAIRIESRLMDLRIMNDSGVGAIEAAERAGLGSIVTLRNFLKRHDEEPLWISLAARNPEVEHDRPESAAVARAGLNALAARRSWTELLATEVTIPGTTERRAVNNMTADQLEAVATALNETKRRLFVLAGAVRLHDVETPADLPSAAFSDLALDVAS